MFAASFSRTPGLLPRALLLSALLHLWAALMLGTAPGVQQPGFSPWGRLNVELRGGGVNASSDPAADSGPSYRDDSATGAAPTPRHGGRLREQPAPPEAGPGAQQAGRWSARERLEDPPQPDAPPDSLAPHEAPHEAPPTLRELAETPAALPARQPRLQAPALPAAPLLEAPRALELPSQSTEPPRQLEAAPTAPRPTAPRVDRPALPPLSPTPSLSPMTLPEPEPAPRLLDAAPLPSRSDLKALPAERLQAPTARELGERLQPLPPAALPADAPPAAATPATPTDPSLNDEAALRGEPQPAPAPRGQPAGVRAPAGSPDAGARVGHDMATPPSAAASAPLRPLQALDLSLPRSGPRASPRTPGVLALLPPLPERKSKLEKAVGEGDRADCRQAHAEAGLLAAVPLAVDTARDKGCKW